MSKKVFIGGPITHLMSEKGFDFDFKKMHERIVEILSKKGYLILSAHIVEKFGENKIEPDEVIVDRDLSWIDDADLCIFLLPTDECEPVRTDGTFIEIGYAAAKCDRNIAFWDLKSKAGYSPMFRGMTDKNMQMYDLGEIEEVLNNLE